MPMWVISPTPSFRNFSGVEALTGSQMKMIAPFGICPKVLLQSSGVPVQPFLMHSLYQLFDPPRSLQYPTSAMHFSTNAWQSIFEYGVPIYLSPAQLKDTASYFMLSAFQKRRPPARANRRPWLSHPAMGRNQSKCRGHPRRRVDPDPEGSAQHFANAYKMVNLTQNNVRFAIDLR